MRLLSYLFLRFCSQNVETQQLLLQTQTDYPHVCWRYTRAYVSVLCLSCECRTDCTSERGCPGRVVMSTASRSVNLTLMWVLVPLGYTLGIYMFGGGTSEWLFSKFVHFWMTELILNGCKIKPEKKYNFSTSFLLEGIYTYMEVSKVSFNRNSYIYSPLYMQLSPCSLEKKKWKTDMGFCSPS